MKNKIALYISTIMIMSASLHALNLKESIQQTIKNNPAISERVKNYNSTLQDIKIAKAGWLPTLDYLGSIGYERVNTQSTGFSNKGSDIYENSLVLVENIFNGWSTTHQINTHRARAAAAAYNYIEKVNDISFNLVNYYIQVVKNRELLDIAKQNIKINETIQKKVKKLYDSGLTTKSELEKINASLSLAYANYTVQQNNLLDSLYQYKYYYGKKVEADSLEKPDFTYTLPFSYKEGRDFAVKHNPSILVQRYNIKVAQEDRLEKKSGYYPKIDLEAKESWSKNTGGIDGKDTRFRAVVKITWNLFRGFSDKQKIQKGTSKVNQEVQIKNDLVRQTIESYDLSWNAYKQIEKQLKYLKKYKKYALSTLRLYSKEYDLGRRSLLDLLSAQNDLINAKSQIVTATYNHLFAKYRILDAMGSMTTSILGNIQPIYKNVKFLNDKKSKEDIFPKTSSKENDKFLKTLEKNRNSSKQ